MNFNLLERKNHLMYYLAIGKLHVGYAHAQDKFHIIYQRCLEKLLFIEKTLRAKLQSPVYRFCKKDHSKLTLKKTNVFRLQKDYRQVYNLLKIFAQKDQTLNVELATSDLPEEGYAAYCTLLSLFAVGHFHFKFNQKQTFDFTKLNAVCAFKNWKLRIKKVSFSGVSALQFCIDKDKTYTVCLILHQNTKIPTAKLLAFQNKYPADEFLFAEPTEYGAKERVYLNLFDIDSFRRIQQFVLRGMVYADEKRDVCPFCGMSLTKDKDAHVCELCKTVIAQKVCPETEKPYFYTDIKDWKRSARQEDTDAPRHLWQEKETEAGMFYRNITPLSAGKHPRCPHCGKLHR